MFGNGLQFFCEVPKKSVHFRAGTLSVYSPRFQTSYLVIQTGKLRFIVETTIVGPIYLIAEFGQKAISRRSSHERSI